MVGGSTDNLAEVEFFSGRRMLGRRAAIMCDGLIWKDLKG